MDVSDCPKLNYKWFVATNNPLEDLPGPISSQSDTEAQDGVNPGRDKEQAKLVNQREKQSNVATIWQPFSDEESDALEQEFYRLEDLEYRSDNKRAGIVIVSDDYFEVDIERRVIYPIYWEGPKYRVLRASWFSVESSGAVPLAEQMCQQIEDGYKKFQPWKAFAASFSPTSATSPTDAASKVTKSESAGMLPSVAKGSATVSSPAASNSNTQTKLKWSLFGPFANNYILFTQEKTGWLMKDDLTSAFTQAIYSRMSSGDNLGGIRIIRGWDLAEHERRQSVKPNTSAEKTAQSPRTPSPTKTHRLKTGEKRIRHIVFAIHGIGQKLGEKVTAVNFVEDCNVLRKNFNDCMANNIIGLYDKKVASKNALSKNASNSPVEDVLSIDSVMVIPIEWRKKLNFDSTAQFDEEMPDRFPTIYDLTLDTVPSLRNIVSDVILDVLLYMEPMHHADIISHVINEANRLYSLFIERHPSFLEPLPDHKYNKPKVGECHFYTHSLGSIIASDIVCYHHSTKQKFRTDNKKSPGVAMNNNDEEDFVTTVDLSELSLDMTKTERLDSHRMERKVTVQLKFPISKVFLMGSPLGLFCLLKSKKIGVTLDTMLNFYQEWFSKHKNTSQDKNELIEYLWNQKINAIMHHDTTGLYNIFHPNDAVAHRLEPLISLQYVSQKPMVLPSAKPLTGLYGLTEAASKTTADLSSKASGILDSFKSSMISLAIQSASADKPKKENEIKQANEESHHPGPLRTSMNDAAPAPRFKPEDIMNTLNPRNKRLDYAFNIGLLENPYISALSAHFNYWKDEECATFVLKEILEINDSILHE